jgi:hypothetical protein
LARVRGERLAWLVTLPIAAIGCEAAHAVANLVFGTADGDTSPFVLSTGRNADLVTLVASLAAVSVVLGLAGRSAGAWSTHRTAAARLPFALLAPAAFLLQEHLETLLHTGAAPFGTVLHPTFLAGLLLQIPFALAGYAVARALIRLADGVRALIDRRRRRTRTTAAPPKARPAYRTPPRSAAHSWAHSGRAPPRAVSAPA